MRRLLSLAFVLLTPLPVLAQLNASSPPPVSVTTVPAITKGTQGATGFTTQDVKDAGRTRVSFTADKVTPAASDTLVTFTQNVAGTATTSKTTYSVTAGKSFRFQGFSIGIATSTTTAFSIRVAVRENIGGTCTASSAPVAMLEAATLTAIANEGANAAAFLVPDGWEFPAADSLCISAVASSATGTLTVTMMGYEY